MACPSSYVLPFYQASTHKPQYPECTAKRPSGDDVRFQVWSNRKAMAKTIRMQQKRAAHRLDWQAIVPLGDAEGF